jgi:integrase/recombinase XerD
MPLLPEPGNALLAYMLARKEVDHDTLFVTMGDTPRPLTDQTLACMIRRRLKRAGVTLPEKVSYGAHSLRHRFACRHVTKLSLKALGELMGHRTLQATSTYARVDTAQLALAALPWPEVQR